jgi:LysM repeat protein
MNTLNQLKEFFRENWLTLLAILVLIGALGANVFFYISNIAPALAARNQVSAQIRDARDVLVESRRIQNEPPATVQARVNAAQTKLASVINPLVSITQTNAFIDSLYQYADESHVTIMDLQAQATSLQPAPTPISAAPATPSRPVPTLIPSSATGASTAVVQTTPTPTQPAAATATRVAATLAPTLAPERDVFYAKVLKIQASGNFHQLNEFVSRIKELNSKPVVLSSVNITGTESRSTLNLELTLYVSSFAGGTGAIGAPTPTNTVPPRPAQPAPPAQQPQPVVPQPTAMPIPPSTATQVPVATASPMATLTATPTASLTATPGPRTIIYTVVPGDTLFSIARRFNTTPEAISNVNHLSSSLLRIGQQLIVPLP